ncbi:N-acetyltransferase family protein [Streptomyces sp. MAR4 CNY-716]
MLIRDAAADDWPAIWPFFHRIVAAGETYPYALDMSAEQGREVWMPPPPDRTTVAVDGEGLIVGSAKMNANRQGNGDHVASASYMVDPDRFARGTGRALCEDSLRWARARGFLSMEFNAVVETNVHAVKLYESLGFRITGTQPRAFRHPVAGLVGLHCMHVDL